MVTSSQTVQLYDRIRSAILDLDLAPGESITERGLEALFHASRTPVRAALMSLQSDGLVQRAGRGWIVAPIDLAEIRALAEWRESVETAAVRLAVLRASDASLNDLAANLNAARPTGDAEHGVQAGVQAGSDFHVELARLSHNQFMAHAIADAMTRLSRTRWLEVRTAEARERAWQEHCDVVDAVRARDADAAVRLVTEHIRGTNERLLEFLTAERRRLRGRGLSIVSGEVD
ncbi:GntR family transcriptional regulator [Leifsonia kafniensis]|uniref:GntR family transcriptional regulator n=1 Tax=Leifsonia kafniensis TaxID=475957 RepID=A0ABP7KYK1_9MICO